MAGVLPHLPMGTPSATSTKDPIIDTESDDDVSLSVIDTRKMATVDNIINNSRMQMDDIVPYHKFSNHKDQQVHDKLREKQFALAKGYCQLVTKKVVIWFKTRTYEVIKQQVQSSK